MTPGASRTAGPDPDDGQRPAGGRTPISARTERLLGMQGFTCTSDPAFGRVVPWLRLSPGLTTLVTAVGVVVTSPAVLVALALVTATCAASARHPFDALYDRGVRRVTGTPPLPRSEPPRRFACGMATVWLVAIAGTFWLGAALAGYVLGAVLVVLGGLVATTHFCFGSLVYQVLVRRRHGAPEAPGDGDPGPDGPGDPATGRSAGCSTSVPRRCRRDPPRRDDTTPSDPRSP